MGASITQLIPIQELTPGQVGAIRNGTINSVVALASRELGLPEDRLVVRDIRPLEDLELYSQANTTGSTNDWRWDATDDTGYNTLSSSTATMADDRYIALFGVRDLRYSVAASLYTCTAPFAGGHAPEMSRVSLIRLSVGGAYKVIWDTKGLSAYEDAHVGFSPSALIIPPNASYKVEYYQDRAILGAVWMQLIGVVVEPRGKTITP